MTYQQLEAMRIRARELGLSVEWYGKREEDEAWLRVSQGINEIVLCWFPARPPILSVEIQAHGALVLVHQAVELVAIHAALTAGVGHEVAL